MKPRWILLTALVLGARPLAAQDASDVAAARAALTACIAAAESSTDRAAAKPSADTAERLWSALVDSSPRLADAHAGLGEVLARCAIPQAGMSTIMTVVERATASLQAALAIDAQHWQARFMLGMIYFNMPAFLNRMPDAIREFEVLRAQQGTRADAPHFALTWLRLGDAYARAGRKADAQAAFAVGAKLFPANQELQTKSAEAGAPSGETSPAPVARELPPVIALAPLRVELAQHQLEEARSSASLRRLDILTMPGGTGEMLQTLQALPGTTRAGDGADLYVRGGDPEETPIFVNGGRMAFPGRWESLGGTTMGVLDASVLSRAYFSAGAFSAKYGNALSGIVDVESQGRPSEGRWRAGVNLVSLGGSAYRPLGERAGTWGTVLLTDVSLLARMQGQHDLYPDMPRSYQAVAGGSVQPHATLELKAVALASGDESARLIQAGGHHGAFASTGATQHGALSARWLRADGRAGLNGSVTASRRSGGYHFGVLERDRTDDAFGARIDADVVAVRGARFRAGAELTRFGALTEGTVPLTPSVAPGSPATALPGEREAATHAGAYIEAERPLGALIAVLGVRADRLPGLDGTALDPRAALAYAAGTWTLRAAGGIFHQGTWRRKYELPDAGSPHPVATRARHLVLGLERGGEPSVRVEAYRKLYDRFERTATAGPVVTAGSSDGIDAIVRWQRQSKLNGWITYSLLDATLQLEDDTEIRARYDITHSLTAVARYALTEAWELGTTLRYATGRPYTPVLGAQPSDTEGWPLEPIHGELLSERLPDYARVDARITRYQPIGRHTGVFYLEMLDLNGRRNVMGYQYDASWTRREPIESFFARRTFVLGAELEF